MPESLTKQRVLNYLDAFYTGDVKRALDQCADDIDYIGYAPVDLLPHLGHKHGKTSIANTLHHLHKVHSAMRHEIGFMATDGAKVAVMLQVHLTKRSNGRIIRIELADFYTCRNGLIAEHRQFMDSFDAIQQSFERDLTETVRRKAGG